VHEAYLRLVDMDRVQRWSLQAHFFAAALGVSTSSAEKDWAYARSWLRVAIDRMSGHRP